MKWECCATLHLTITFTHFVSSTMSMRRKNRVHAWSHPCDQGASIRSSHIHMTRVRPYEPVTSYNRFASVPDHNPYNQLVCVHTNQSRPCDQKSVRAVTSVRPKCIRAGHVHATKRASVRSRPCDQRASVLVTSMRPKERPCGHVRATKVHPCWSRPCDQKSLILVTCVQLNRIHIWLFLYS